jgi:hypothetical protein
MATSEKLHFWVKCSVNAAIAILLIVLMVSCINNLREWAYAWEFEKKVLNSIPHLQITAVAKENSFLIIDSGLSTDNVVEGVGAYWDITGALFVLYPDLRSKFATSRNRPFATMLNKNKMLTVWDGERISQFWCGASKPGMELWKLDAPNQVFLWEYASQKLTLYEKPLEIGCGK